MQTETINPRDANRLIAIPALQDLLGGVCDMTIRRWLDRPELQFPRPIFIARRRYWKEAEIIAWLSRQSNGAAAQ